jgi:hypothetical protein
MSTPRGILSSLGSDVASSQSSAWSGNEEVPDPDIWTY